MKKTLIFSAALASLAFSANAQSFSNAGYEAWHDYKVAIKVGDTLGLQAPDAWFGVDSLIAGLTPLAGSFGVKIEPKQQVFKSDKAHSGTSATKLVTANLGDKAGMAPGILTNAEVEIDLISAAGDQSNILKYVTYKGGTSVTAMVDTVSAWILLESTNKDNGLINVSAVKIVNDSSVVVGTGKYVITTHNEYTQVFVPITYTSTDVPEKLIVSFLSSNVAGKDDVAHEGNTLFVDDVAFSYSNGSVSIRQPLLSENQMIVYPNPADKQIYFNLNANVHAEDFTLIITDVTGKVISQEKLAQQVNAKNVANWARGTYSYNLSNTKTGVAEQGKFIVK